MVRLSASQLRRSYTALLGDGLVLPELPLDEAGAGFSSVAAAVTTVARREAEVYEAAAYAVLDQVWAEADRRDALVGCAPVDLEAPCVDVFLEDSASHVPGGARPETRSGRACRSSRDRSRHAWEPRSRAPWPT